MPRLSPAAALLALAGAAAHAQSAPRAAAAPCGSGDAPARGRRPSPSVWSLRGPMVGFDVDRGADPRVPPRAMRGDAPGEAMTMAIAPSPPVPPTPPVRFELRSFDVLTSGVAWPSGDVDDRD